jgi:hypothetical protein
LIADGQVVRSEGDSAFSLSISLSQNRFSECNTTIRHRRFKRYGLDTQEKLGIELNLDLQLKSLPFVTVDLIFLYVMSKGVSDEGCHVTLNFNPDNIFTLFRGEAPVLRV